MPVPRPEPRGYPGNLGSCFAEHATASRTAIVDLRDRDQPREIGYAELDRLCDALARGLVRAGIGSGDRIAILSLNRHEFVATVLGAMRAGAVPVPINIKSTPDTVGLILDDAKARLVFLEPAFERLCPTSLRKVEYGSNGAHGFDRFLDPGEFTAIEPGPETVAIQPYTSGSKGRP